MQSSLISRDVTLQWSHNLYSLHNCMFLCFVFNSSVYSLWKSCLFIIILEQQQGRRRENWAYLFIFVLWQSSFIVCVCLCLCLLSLWKLADRGSLLIGRGERDETRSNRQISAHWNPIGKVIYIVLLKSTCDLIDGPIHNPDTLHSCLSLFCKHMVVHAFAMGEWPCSVMGRSCVSSGHFSSWPEVVQLQSFTLLWCLFLGALADPRTFFCMNAQYECSFQTAETDNRSLSGNVIPLKWG